jgi:hypothetical protein
MILCTLRGILVCAQTTTRQNQNDPLGPLNADPGEPQSRLSSLKTVSMVFDIKLRGPHYLPPVNRTGLHPSFRVPPPQAPSYAAATQH